MGLERLTMTILGLKNIREASLFPSDPKRIAGNRIKAKIFFGGENIRNEIIRLIKQNEMEYRHGIQTDENPDGAISVKSLILRGKSSRKNYHITLFAHMKVDMKAVAEQTGEKCDFEDAGTIQERFGLSPASIPPFGHLLNIDTFFDERVLNATRLSFNCGILGESVALDSKDLISLAKPKLGCFAKE